MLASIAERKQLRILQDAKIDIIFYIAKFLSSECREKLVFTLLSREKIRLWVKFCTRLLQNKSGQPIQTLT